MAILCLSPPRFPCFLPPLRLTHRLQANRLNLGRSSQQPLGPSLQKWWHPVVLVLSLSLLLVLAPVLLVLLLAQALPPLRCTLLPLPSVPCQQSPPTRMDASPSSPLRASYKRGFWHLQAMTMTMMPAAVTETAESTDLTTAMAP
jgi:hypothetical protein